MVNGKSPSNNFDISAPIYNNQNHTNMPANYFPYVCDQVLTDPVQLMRRFTENAPKQQKSIYSSATDKPLFPSSRKEDPCSASSDAAWAWMSIGAGSPKSVSENTRVHNRNQIFVKFVSYPHTSIKFSE